MTENTNFYQIDFDNIALNVDKEIEAKNKEEEERRIKDIVKQEVNRSISQVIANLKEKKFITFININRDLNKKAINEIINQLKKNFLCFDEVEGNEKERMFMINISRNLKKNIDIMKQEIREEYEEKMKNMIEMYKQQIGQLEKEIEIQCIILEEKDRYSHEELDLENSYHSENLEGDDLQEKNHHSINDQELPHYVEKVTEKIKKTFINSQAEILFFEIEYEEKIKSIEKYISNFNEYLHERIVRTSNSRDKIACNTLRDDYNRFRKAKGRDEINSTLFPILCHHFGIRKSQDRRLGYSYIQFKK
jgi:hypothetical protein